MPTNGELFFARKEAISNAVADYMESIAPKAKVIRRFAFDVNSSQWAKLLLSNNDLDSDSEPLIRTIQVYYKSDQQTEGAPIGSLAPVLTLGIDFFHQYDFGTDADNSEKRLVKEVSLAQWLLATHTDLGMNDVPDTHPGYAAVMGHTGLGIAKYDLNDELFGDRPIQYALGELVVLLQTSYTFGQ